MTDQEILLCIDMGTTRTRAWLTRGNHIQGHLVRDFGVRNAAQGFDLKSALLDLLHETMATSGKADGGDIHRVAAAGMITSQQGLLEIPHLPVPAGVELLAAGVKKIHIGTSERYELLLVPGVRSGDGSNDMASVLDTDIMRGEETLCMGLLDMGLLEPGSAVLNLGSHWKWVWIDPDGRIAGSRTALTGEMIHAVQAHTLLASALPQRPPTMLESEWLARGAEEARRSGLSRALFCVRLLQQTKQGSSDQRLAFLYGAFLEMEFETLPKIKMLRDLRSVCIVGSPALAGAWKMLLARQDITANVLEEPQRDAAYLAGLRKIMTTAISR